MIKPTFSFSTKFTYTDMAASQPVFYYKDKVQQMVIRLLKTRKNKK